jgi:hypothetical protein
MAKKHLAGGGGKPYKVGITSIRFIVLNKEDLLGVFDVKIE